jgi:hypothetical protein
LSSSCEKEERHVREKSSRKIFFVDSDSQQPAPYGGGDQGLLCNNLKHFSKTPLALFFFPEGKERQTR